MSRFGRRHRTCNKAPRVWLWQATVHASRRQIFEDHQERCASANIPKPLLDLNSISRRDGLYVESDEDRRLANIDKLFEVVERLGKVNPGLVGAGRILERLLFVFKSSKLCSPLLELLSLRGAQPILNIFEGLQTDRQMLPPWLPRPIGARAYSRACRILPFNIRPPTLAVPCRIPNNIWLLLPL